MSKGFRTLFKEHFRGFVVPVGRLRRGGQVQINEADIDRAEASRCFRTYFPYFVLLACICDLDRLLFGKFVALDIYDSIEVHFVHYKAMARVLSDFGLFGWYPGIAGGQPAFASQHPPYALPTLLSMALPIWQVSLIWTMCLQVAAGWGMYRMLREVVRVGDRVALYLACLFMITLMYGIVHLVFSFAFPLFAVWTRDLFDRELSRFRRFAVFLGILAMMLTAFPVLSLPHFPVFHFALVLCFCWGRKDLGLQLSQVVLVWTAFVLLYSPLILSLFQYIPFAQRSWHPVPVEAGPALLDFLKSARGRAVSIPVISLVLLAVPFAFRLRRLRVPFLFVLVPLVVSGIFGSELRHLFANTFFVKMDLFLSSTVLGISGIIVVALLAQHLVEQRQGVPLLFALPVLALCITFGAEYRVLRHMLIFASLPLFLFILGGDAKRARRSLLALPAILALLVMFSRQEYAAAGMVVPYAKGFDSHHSLKLLARESRGDPFRVACLDVHPAIAQSYGLETVDLKFPLFNRYYKQYVSAALAPQFDTPLAAERFHEVWRQLYLTRSKNDHDQRPLALETGAPHSLQEFELGLMRSMNVRYFLSSKPLLDSGADAEFVARDPGLELDQQGLMRGLAKHYALPIYIYRLKHSAPRAYLASRVLVVDDRKDVLRVLVAGNQTNNTHSAVFFRPDLNAAPPESHPGSAVVTRYAPDELCISGNSEGSGTLVISNNVDPNWQAFVNGNAVQTLRVNHAFQAVPVGPGEFSVRLVYENLLLWRMHWAVLAALLLLCVGPLAARKSVGRHKASQHDDALPVWVGGSSWWVLAAQLSVIPAVWGVGYYFFEVIKRTTPNTSWFAYILATTPVIGALTALWGRAFFRRILRADD